MSFFQSPLLFLFFFIFCHSNLFAQNGDEKKTVNDVEVNIGDGRYDLNKINKARYGSSKMQKYIKKALTLSEEISKEIVGQEEVANLLQHKLVQTLENFGSRKKDPVAMHLIGLPGIGKSAMLAKIKEVTGIDVFIIEAQQFISYEKEWDLKNIFYQISENLKKGNPTAVIFDEIDKVPEITQGEGPLGERTNYLIGSLNEILTDGKVDYGRTVLDFSNALILTAMNFSSEEISNFSEEILKEKKNFFDYSIEDLEKFHEWITTKPSAKNKVLSKLFRPNTVGRLGPNISIVKPLNDVDYRKIVKANIEASIASNLMTFKERKLKVSYTENLVDFFKQHSVDPPTGARMTVFHVKNYINYLINYGTKAKGPSDGEELNRPRHLLLDYNQERGITNIKVTPMLYTNKQWRMRTDDEFDFDIEFNKENNYFIRPSVVEDTAPELIERKERADVITKKQIYEARFPKVKAQKTNLAEKINQFIIGQNAITKLIEERFDEFIQRPVKNLERPAFSLLAGFPGIGKSEIAKLTAHFTGLEIVQINMQDFQSNESEVVDKFLTELIKKTQNFGPEDRYVLLIEELDKIHEVNPQTGFVVDRPVISILKELMNSGRLQKTVNRGSYTDVVNLDIRNAFTFLTMNFGVDRFGFQADPRLTSVDDVMNAWDSMSRTLANKKKVFGSLFLPETVSRLINNAFIVKPLTHFEYQKLIKIVSNSILDKKFTDPKTKKNLSQIFTELSSEYKKYLYAESVIPSEGARNTVITVQDILGQDLEFALKSIPKSSQLAKEPIVLKFDFKPVTQSRQQPIVIAKIKLRSGGAWRELYTRPVVLRFPSPKVFGKVPQGRLLTSIHEFGHAMEAVRLGKRFGHVVSYSPINGVGGFVSFIKEHLNDFSNNAAERIQSIYLLLAARAMEKIFLSDDPLSNKANLQIRSGASGDITQASSDLFFLLKKLGHDPRGIIYDHQEGSLKAATLMPGHGTIDAKEMERMGKILADMEKYIIEDFLKAHSREWYADKITKVAFNGIYTEKNFYQLIDYPYPGKEGEAVGVEASNLNKFFNNIIQEPTEDALKAKKFKQGETQTTATENMQKALNIFEEILDKHYKGADSGNCNPHFTFEGKKTKK